MGISKTAVKRVKKRPPSHVGKVEPAIVGKNWKKNRKLDTRLLPVHRYVMERTERWQIAKQAMQKEFVARNDPFSSGLHRGIVVSSSDKLLYGDEWLELRQIDGWYTYARNKAGDGVLVLGLRPKSKQQDRTWEFLARMEQTPPHGSGHRLTSLTGTIESGLSPEETALKELREESGYEIQADCLTPLGWIFLWKGTDYKLHLFAANLEGKPQHPIEGDGSEGEKDATVRWIQKEEAARIQDAGFLAALFRARQQNLWR
jgi:8-oxo-dGTP pyrophosphatase MutT (NUDIX family)